MHTHSHTHTQFNTLTVNGVRLGLEHKYLVTLRKETNHISRLQTFTFEDIEEELEEKIYWCAICKLKLSYLPNTDTIWRCDNCLSYYDTKIQDAPIKDKSQLKLHSYHDPYQQYDANDPNIPFAEGIDLEAWERGAEEEQILGSSPDRRIQHIKVRGNLADAQPPPREIEYND